jgi:hypothetical protein
MIVKKLHSVVEEAVFTCWPLEMLFEFLWSDETRSKGVQKFLLIIIPILLKILLSLAVPVILFFLMGGGILIFQPVVAALVTLFSWVVLIGVNWYLSM